MQGTNVRCVYEIATDLKSAHIDPEQIAQVIQNLLLNAVQAMTSGGSVRIVLNNAESPASSLALAPGSYIRLAIIDTGGGIAPEALPRIFDPFFTTKKGNGGLGLATAYSVIKKHGGHIEAHSQVGHGTTFTVWLPGLDSPQTPAPFATVEMPPAKSASPGSRIPRVLLMDDEESIRRLGALLLHRLGFEAVTVPDGAAALLEIEKAKKSGDLFSLLILDLTIPNGMGGKDAIAAIRQIDSHTPAIVCSGYSRDPVLANFASFGFQAMITKPYEIGKMTEAIQRFLPAAAKTT
jgi:two-component system cell cycle sensor histidine kinase/response regulator CckA